MLTVAIVSGLFVAFAAVVHAGYLGVLRVWLGHRPTRVPETEGPRSFRPLFQTEGAGLIGFFRTFAPSMTLAADHEWAQIRAGRRTIWIGRAEATVANVRTNIRFLNPSGRFDGVTLWLGDGKKVIEAMSELDWDTA